MIVVCTQGAEQIKAVRAFIPQDEKQFSTISAKSEERDTVARLVDSKSLLLEGRFSILIILQSNWKLGSKKGKMTISF